jgi:D-aspartate ligase
MAWQALNRTAHTPKPGCDTPGAVILGGAHGSLAVARSLGRHGIPVWFVTHDHPITKYSRFATRSFRWAGPCSEHAAEWLLELAARHRLDRWVLFAGGDEEVCLVSRHYTALERAYRVTTPRWAISRIACDKRLTYHHALSVGVDCPWSRFPRDRDEVAALDCRFPVIIKPTIRFGRNALTAAKAWRVDDRAALLRRYDEAAALVGADAIIIQELVTGGGDAQFSYAGAWHDGIPVASLVARRKRQYPIDFGLTSTFVESIEQSTIEEAATRFLAALKFSGLVELEFKHDSRDGRYKLLDVNPRPWTWIALGSAAGADFPWIQYQLACGSSPAPSRGRAGAGWSHASRDILAVVQEIANGTRSPSAARTALHAMTFAAIAVDDLLPGIVDLPVVVARVLKRRYFERSPQPDKRKMSLTTRLNSVAPPD